MEDWRKLAAEADQRNEKIPEKRKGPDLLIKAIRGLSLITWVLMLVIIILVEKAKPDPETFFDRWMNLSTQQGWDLDLYRSAFFLMLSVMLLACSGLLLNSFRRRRKTDSWRVNLVLVFLMALAGSIHYLMKYKTLG
ncbi:hypothetical protein [Marinospirillum insulare]|nr:hypothetical protein [Marinospirillum insulare]